MARGRADRMLVERGLAASVDEAARFILAGEVFSGVVRVTSPAQTLGADAPLTVRLRRRYVSRGGEKLAAALDHFSIAPDGRVCLDAGCSTGGFTDCLLQRGATRVYAVDVGYGQFAWTLRHDQRVELLERTSVRALEPASLDPRPDLVVADLAFISLRTVLPVLAAFLEGPGDLLLLVKPQFELAREDVKGGVVTDPQMHGRAVELVERAALDLALEVAGHAPSPLLGPKGNREFFVALRRTGPGAGSK
jgi:23S rRNA (cytidine1920-2'-O)/16S rRNA (cytidine1409-2'-O)-methyltransferase